MDEDQALSETKVLTDKDNEKTLPFSETQQEAIVGHCLSDKLFFLSCVERIRPTWFTHNALVATLFDQLIKFYKDQKRTPKHPEELLSSSFFNELPDAENLQYRHKVDHCIVSASKFGIEKLKKDLTGFIRIAMFSEAMQKGSVLFNVQGFDDAYEKTRVKLQEIQKANFVDDSLVIPFDNPEKWLEEDKEDVSKIISTGCHELDVALGGGLFPGDCTAIMAPTNVGKTTFMLTIARHAAMQGKSVLFITHEGKPKSIRTKFLTSLVGCTKNDLIKDTMEGKAAAFKDATNFLSEHITYIHYSKAMGMYVEDVMNEIKRRTEEKILKDGKGYDLIIDDYPAKQKSRILMDQKSPRHEELAYIYDQYNLLAGELKNHIMVAVQTNRDGFKQNFKSSDSSEYLDMDNVSGSYGICQNIPNMIAMNRNPKDMGLNLLHLKIIKSRDTATQQSVHTKTNYAFGLTHGDAKMFSRFCQNRDLLMVGLISQRQESSEVKTSDSVNGELQAAENSAMIAAKALMN